MQKNRRDGIVMMGLAIIALACVTSSEGSMILFTGILLVFMMMVMRSLWYDLFSYTTMAAAGTLSLCAIGFLWYIEIILLETAMKSCCALGGWLCMYTVLIMAQRSPSGNTNISTKSRRTS